MADRNDTRCPLCAKKNHCMAHSTAPCWCNKITIPNELISLVPEKSRGRRCICQSCIRLFKENPTEFNKRYTIN